MDGNARQLTLWLAGFVGVGLLYAAYKGNMNPTKLLAASLGNTSAKSGLLSGKAGTPASAAAPASTSGVATSVQPILYNGTYYVTDQYGNPVDPIDKSYTTTPNTYIPPKAV